MDGDEVDDHNDRDMLLLSLLLCQNAALQRGPCDLPFVWVHVRVEEACSCNGLWSLIVESLWLHGLGPLVVESLSRWGHGEVTCSRCPLCILHLLLMGSIP